MNENRRYYYLKLKETFYTSEAMVYLESLPEGFLLSNILVKLYLIALKDNGVLMLTEQLPHNSQTIATFTRHQLKTVERALKVFVEMGLVEVLNNGAFYMTNLQMMIGQSSSEGERKRKERLQLQQQNLLPTTALNPDKADICPPTSKPNKADIAPPKDELPKADKRPSKEGSPKADKCPPKDGSPKADKCPPNGAADKTPLILENRDKEIREQSIELREEEKAHSLGRYSNVQLTSVQLSALQDHYPQDWQKMIERLSEYMESTGKRYNNHLATMEHWAEQDAEKKKRPYSRLDYTVKEGETV